MGKKKWNFDLRSYMLGFWIGIVIPIAVALILSILMRGTEVYTYIRTDKAVYLRGEPMTVAIELSGSDAGSMEGVELDVTARWEVQGESWTIENWTRTNWMNIPIENFKRKQVDGYSALVYTCTLTPVVLPPPDVVVLYEFRADPYIKDLTFIAGDPCYASGSSENWGEPLTYTIEGKIVDVKIVWKTMLSRWLETGNLPPAGDNYYWMIQLTFDDNLKKMLFWPTGLPIPTAGENIKVMCFQTKLDIFPEEVEVVKETF